MYIQQSRIKMIWGALIIALTGLSTLKAYEQADQNPYGNDSAYTDKESISNNQEGWNPLATIGNIINLPAGVSGFIGCSILALLTLPLSLLGFGVSGHYFRLARLMLWPYGRKLKTKEESYAVSGGILLLLSAIGTLRSLRTIMLTNGLIKKLKYNKPLDDNSSFQEKFIKTRLDLINNDGEKKEFRTKYIRILKGQNLWITLTVISVIPSHVVNLSYFMTDFSFV